MNKMCFLCGTSLIQLSSDLIPVGLYRVHCIVFTKYLYFFYKKSIYFNLINLFLWYLKGIYIVYWILNKSV